HSSSPLFRSPFARHHAPPSFPTRRSSDLHELAAFSAELARRPQIVLGNKCDIAAPEQVEAFRAFIEEQGLTFLPISAATRQGIEDRKSTRLNSSHVSISYAVFCLKKKKKH